MAPPGWPPPPYPGWAPPSGWRPDPEWPEAPAGWQFWATSDNSAASTRIRAGAVMTCLGAVLAVVGAFGPWITIATRFGQAVHSTGFQGGHDGPYVFALAVVVLGVSAPRLARRRVPRWLDVVAIVAGTLLLAICVADLADVRHRAVAVGTAFPQLSGHVGGGLVLAVVGAALALLGALIAIDLRRVTRSPHLGSIPRV